MPPSSASASFDAPAPRHWLRVVAVLVFVLAVHGLAMQWVARYREPFKPVAPADIPVEIQLLKPERIERQPAAAPKPAEQRPRAAPARSTPAAREPQAPPQHEAAVLSTVESPVTTTAPAATAASAASAPARAASGTAATLASAGAASGAAAPAPQAATGVKFALPPSGDLQYDTYYNGVQNETGTIHWHHEGDTYELRVSMPVPFVGPFTYESRGRIDAFGLAPDRYVERRGRRPADIAIFNRETRQIVFTRTPKSLALPDGAQDRFSMLLELSSLVRGDPDAYRPGVTRDFYVVDNDSGETWPITTIGDDSVRTRTGRLDARHFMRLPRHPGDKRRIDIWLAPSLGWLPVRMVQTEPNGTQIDLVLDERAKPANEDDNETAHSTDPANDGPVNSTDQATPIADPNDAHSNASTHH